MLELCIFVLDKWTLPVYNNHVGKSYSIKDGVNMPVSESRKRANAKWDSANLDRISLALPKGSRERIKAFAESQGESVNSFVKKAIDEAMSGCSGVSADDIVSLDYEAINAHIQKTEETTAEFLARAVRDTMNRDESMLQMGLKIVK